MIMERSNFINLLDEYKNKALSELYKESRVQASLLVTGEFKKAISDLERAVQSVSSGFKEIKKEVDDITTRNALDDIYRNGFYYNTPTTRVMELVIDYLSDRIRNTQAYKQKKYEVGSKFDAVIKAAKASRSATRLKELADAIGVETPEIEVNTKVASEVDTDFVKEKIQSVLLLK